VLEICTFQLEILNPETKGIFYHATNVFFQNQKKQLAGPVDARQFSSSQLQSGAIAQIIVGPKV
jgi:hypothetical protein